MSLAICLAFSLFLATTISQTIALPEIPDPTLAASISLDMSRDAMWRTGVGADLGADRGLPDDPATSRWLESRVEDDEAVVAEPVSSRVELLPLFFTLNKQHTDSVNNQPSTYGTQHYNWKGLLWESFAFFGVENAFRLMTDNYFRYLTAEKPFWHDYIASVRQWNMGRWSDGDSFIVAYVGHPLQGSVTEFIEIQNDPRGRMLQISRDPEYWKSIFKSLLWATAYSTDQKVGPLGETALGSEGGYTYVIGCAAPCPTYNPDINKVTNNTGWVKLVSTPVVGTMWTLAEDFLDRYVSDRVQGDNLDRVFPKILRGAINPSRTMANGMRGKLPWYRDFQHPENSAGSSVHFESEEEELVRNLPRYAVFPHLNVFSLPVNTSAVCEPCRQFTTGVGAGFSYQMSRWWDLESDVNHQPNASPLPSDKAGGDIVMGTFGFGIGFRTPNYGLRFSVRPGFVSYDRAYFTAPVAGEAPPEAGRITHFATSLAVTGDYDLARHLAVSLSVGNTAVRYNSHRLDRPPGVGTEPYLYWISPDVYITNENWTLQTGPVLRF
jgi:hypothetical protein